MDKLTFDLILDLADKGYTVSFRKNERYPTPVQVICIDLRKGDNQVTWYVDTGVNLHVTISTDKLVAEGLVRAMLDFDHKFRREEKKHDQN